MQQCVTQGGGINVLQMLTGESDRKSSLGTCRSRWEETQTGK
jgi:hypothetical protein